MADICFVMQPFDRGKFDKRFDEVFAPAIRSAGLEPYRVDRDPSVSVPIDEIENNIKRAATCLADLTEDNPNVWFELGMAIAFNKDLCLVCSAERKTKYPFDVQHRTIISYATESKGDFSKLEASITERLKSLLEKRAVLDHLPNSASLTARTTITDFEMMCLAVIGTEAFGGHDRPVSFWNISKDLESQGYNGLATQMGIRRLLERKYIDVFEMTDGDGDSYKAYSLTDSGWKWIDENIKEFDLRTTGSRTRRSPQSSNFARDLDDEVPF